MVRILRHAHLVLYSASLLLCLPHAHAAQPAYAVLDLGPAKGPSSTIVDSPFNGSQRCAYINDLGNVVFANTSGDLTIYHAGRNSVTTVTRNWLMQPGWLNNQDNAGGFAGRLNAYSSPPGGYWNIDASNTLMWSPDHEGPMNDFGLVSTSGPNGRALYDRSTDTFEYFEYDHTRMVPNLFNINAAGDVAGSMYYVGSPGHACLYRRNGPLQDLGTLGGRESVAKALNNLGAVVGWSSTVEGFSHPFLSIPGQPIEDLGTLGAESTVNPSYAFGINDFGAVVGTATAPRTGGGVRRDAFIYTPGGGMQNLNDLVEQNDGTRLAVAAGINNQGQIIAFSALGNNSRLKLLTPTTSVPEPGTLTMLAAGLVAVFAGRKRTTR